MRLRPKSIRQSVIQHAQRGPPAGQPGHNYPARWRQAPVGSAGVPLLPFPPGWQLAPSVFVGKPAYFAGFFASSLSHWHNHSGCLQALHVEGSKVKRAVMGLAPASARNWSTSG